MSAEGIARVDLVIDADGIARTGRSLQTLERYMDKLQRRAALLSRIRITPIVRLSDCLCGPLRSIRMKLTELTSRVWKISVRAKFVMDRKVMESIKAKVKVSVDVKATVDVTAKVKALAEAASGDGGDDGEDNAPWWEKILESLKSFGNDILGEYKDRLKDKAVGGIDKMIEALSGKKGMGFLKVLLPEEDKDKIKVTVNCICKCKCNGTSYGNSRRSNSRSNRRGRQRDGRNGGSGGGGRDREGRGGRGGAGGRGGRMGRFLESVKGKGSKMLRSGGRMLRGAGRLARAGGKAGLLLGGLSMLGGDGLKGLKNMAGSGIKGVAGLFGKAAGAAKGLAGKAAGAVKGLAGGGLKSFAGKAASLGGKALDVAKKLPVKSLAKTALKGAGKLVRPLGLAMDVADIAAAKPGKERNKAIGRAVGGGLGSTILGAVGTMIMPGIGTAIGASLGGMAGEWLGDKIGGSIGKIGGAIGKVGSKIKKFLPFGKKEKKPPEVVPAPTTQVSTDVVARAGVGTASAAAASSVNIQIPSGAVQMTVQNPDIDYDAIAAEIGVRMSATIKQTIENRA